MESGGNFKFSAYYLAACITGYFEVKRLKVKVEIGHEIQDGPKISHGFGNLTVMSLNRINCSINTFFSNNLN